MAQIHNGVSCDGCDITNFGGIRHKCLVCLDYDLCDNCFMQCIETKTHQANHPMEEIIKEKSYSAAVGFDGGNSFSSSLFGWSCPYCYGQYPEQLMYKHVLTNHSGDLTQVDCSICGEVDLIGTDFFNHLLLVHKKPNKKKSNHFSSLFEDGYSPFDYNAMRSHGYGRIKDLYSEKPQNPLRTSLKTVPLRLSGLVSNKPPQSEEEVSKTKDERVLKGVFIQDLLLSTLNKN